MSLTSSYSFFGNGNWSLDAVGGNYTQGGDIQVVVPKGSTVLKAFLYETTYASTAGSVTLTSGSHSDTISTSELTPLGANFGLQAYRTDVTSYVSSVVGSGSADNFVIHAGNITDAGDVDGFALAVVYANPNEAQRTIVLADGSSASTGDNFKLSFDKPVDTTVPGFSADLSLGIGFSYQNGGAQQYSRVSVDGRALTTSAGGEDDGASSNGGLVTIGGVGDSDDNPVNPDATPTNPRSDDELYNLAKGNGADASPFIKNGATSLSIDTLNPSRNDNIFFAGINITAKASVDTTGNDAPTAVNDAYTLKTGSPSTLDVLSNDFDPDKDALTITDVTSAAGFSGKVTIANNKIVFDPQGFTGTESFTYSISDGNNHTASASVALTVQGNDNPQPPSSCPTVDRPGTQNGTAPTNDTLTGPGYHNTFYFDNSGPNTGQDKITNFAKDDIIVTSVALADNNGDGIINYGSNKKFDFGNGGSVSINGNLANLRYLGEYCEDSYVYATASVRPMKAQEGLVNHADTLTGDAANKKGDVFFFDTALDLNLGSDTIKNFGSGDLLVTTTQIRDANGNGVIDFGDNKKLDLPGGVGGPGDPGNAGEGGQVTVTGTSGQQITSLEYDGTVNHGGVNYYVYSLQHSTVGTADLHF